MAHHQFNLNFQAISLHANNFMIWYPCSQRRKIEFMNCIILFHKEWYIMQKVLLITPHDQLYQNEIESWEYENHSAKGFMKLNWKIHEVTRDKGSLSQIWGVPHVKSVRKIINYFRRFMELIEHTNNFSWKVRELSLEPSWNWDCSFCVVILPTSK